MNAEAVQKGAGDPRMAAREPGSGLAIGAVEAIGYVFAISGMNPTFDTGFPEGARSENRSRNTIIKQYLAKGELDNMMDFETARLNMVESQIRPNGITDYRIIAAMRALPRHEFVPQALQNLAYMDENLPLTGPNEGGRRRYLMEPMTFARLVQMAEITPRSLVLDVGCGMGYSTAVLAQLAESVVALEEDEGLAERASEALSLQNIVNGAVVTGRLRDGYAAEGPYDAIVLEGAVAEVPQALLDQLREGGRLVAVVGMGRMGRATVMTRNNGAISARAVFDAGIPVLPGFEPAENTFVF